MANHSITLPDLTREVREELYDGTARVSLYAQSGELISEILVPSFETAPVDPVPPVDQESVESFASDILQAETFQEMKDAAQALLDRLGG